METKQEWTSSKGIKVTLTGVPPYLLQMVLSAVERPQVPTYVVKTASGAEEIHKHDAESIQQSSPEEKAKWDEYLVAERLADALSTTKALNAILMEGVEMDPSVEESLAKRMQFLGIPLPSDPNERTLAVRKAFLIGGKDDADYISATVMRLTGVSPEELESARKSFRDQVES